MFYERRYVIMSSYLPHFFSHRTPASYIDLCEYDLPIINHQLKAIDRRLPTWIRSPASSPFKTIAEQIPISDLDSLKLLGKGSEKYYPKWWLSRDFP